MTAGRWLGAASAAILLGGLAALGLRELGMDDQGRERPSASREPRVTVTRPANRSAAPAPPPQPATPSAALSPEPPTLPLPPAPFETWRDALAAYAQRLGIAQATLDAAFRDVIPLPAVIALDRHQSEYTRTFFGYLKAQVSPGRIARGQALLHEHAALLADIERRHGVPGAVLVALWAMESDYGAQPGTIPVVAALATLAYDGRRRERFTTELIEALRILDSGAVAVAEMTGSWAGAMGQLQFMPSTYRRYARDGDGDGRADIWNSTPDALESAAIYLAASGWQRDQPWGREVRLPPGFDLSQTRLSVTKSLDAWRRLGVLSADAQPLPGGDTATSIVLPAGSRGPAFMVYPNFHVILDWNRSLHYALTAGYLADRLRGAGPLVGRPPPGDRALPRRGVIALQEGLASLGFDAGEADGLIGLKTRDAVQDYQRTRGLPADACPTAELIAAVAREAASATPQTPAAVGTGSTPLHSQPRRSSVRPAQSPATVASP
ncbi:lytic murein transglycosylase [uncultured Thiodictyon sp.]|uniref:lytic murein transglycosylase n=1 Tax=uncultured Thiodictyon sp. TaxID=1846217 RepID=UPI0025D619A3|nr:lytic murein transglycosylase [uncultured Thiodictyon sp.]